MYKVGIFQRNRKSKMAATTVYILTPAFLWIDFYKGFRQYSSRFNLIAVKLVEEKSHVGLLQPYHTDEISCMIDLTLLLWSSRYKKETKSSQKGPIIKMITSLFKVLYTIFSIEFLRTSIVWSVPTDLL